MIFAFLRQAASYLRASGNERGAAAVEYGILVAFIAAVIIGLVVTLGGYVGDAFTAVNTAFDANL